MTEKLSVFETTGEYNQYYNGKNLNSPTLIVPLEIAKSVDQQQRADLVKQIKQPPKPPVQEEKSYFGKVFDGVQKVLDFANQTVSFGLLLQDPKNPIYRGGFSFDNVKKSWDGAGQISAGQSFVRGILGRPLDAIESVFSGAVKAVTGGKLSGFDKFMQDHILFAANEFDIYSKKQREEAFKSQNFGRFSSGTADFVGAFILDPFFIGGKVYKAGRAAQTAVKGAAELKAVLEGTQQGRRADRLRNTFQGFVEDTDGMGVRELLRIRAVRESANPTGLSEIIAQANKIDDVAKRHETKTNIIRLAMGDTTALPALEAQDRMLVAKIAAMEDEVLGAKYLGAGRDKKTGQLTFDLTNNGEQYDNLVEITSGLNDELRNVTKQLEIVGTMTPDAVPRMSSYDSLRAGLANNQRVIELRSGLTGAPVRFFTNFFYKTPRRWIDFTDNQSIQTVDNMLNLVRNVSSRMESSYMEDIAAGKRALAAATDKTAKAAAKKQIRDAERALNAARFTVERRGELLSKYAAAVGPNERAKVFQEIEQDVFTTIARQFDVDDDAARAAYGLWANRRAQMRNTIKERTYTGARTEIPGAPGETMPAGARVKPLVGEDNAASIIPEPILETQLVHKLPTLDVGEMYAVLNRARRADRLGKVYRTGARAKVGLDDFLGEIDSLFKFQALARLGYPVRSVTEGTLRVMAVSGPMAILNRYVNGSVDIAKSLTNDSFDKIYKDRAKTMLNAEREQLAIQVEAGDDTVDVLNRIKEIDEMLSGKKPMRDKYGTGLLEIMGVKIEDALGATPQQAAAIRDMFVRNAGQITDDMFQELHRSNKQFLELTGDWTIVRGTDANWEDAYIRVVNKQLRNSKMAPILFQPGKSWDEITNELERFLLERGEGRKLMKDLAMGRDARGLAEANVQNVQHLFNQAPELMAIAAKRNLTADDLKNTPLFQDALRRPDVNGAQVGNASGMSTAVLAYRNMLRNFYEYVGEAPERVLVNHPMFVDLYRKRINALVRNAIETYPGNEIPSTFLRKLEGQARQWARAELRRTVYDTSESIEAAKYMRYIFPFFRSFADTAQKWSRIVVNDPSTLAALNIVYNAPERLGLTEERDGVTYINVPGEWVKKFKVFGERPLQIPKTSLNLIFSGNSWWNPGAGWFVQIPLAKVMKNVPELERNALVKEILPFGAGGTGFSDVFIQSPAARRVIRMFDTNSPERNNMTVLVMAEENFKYESGERDTRPTPDEIENRVKKMLAMEAAARLVLPFATNTRSPYQFYIDEFQRFREEDPATAAEKFYATYGDDYFAFTTSLSKNNTGIAATIEADKEARRLKDLIAANPDYGWFIIGDKNGGEFSSTVYQRQRELSVQAGGKTKFRESQDPYTAVAETEAEKGWIVYNKGMDILNAELIARGLTSFNSKDAADLNERRQRFITELEAENDAWRASRGAIDTKKVENFLVLARKMVGDERVNQRQDMKTMQAYLDGRNFIIEELAARGGTTLNNEDNIDLKERWDTFITGLIDEDVTFNRIYTRILERDDLRKKI